MMESLIHAASSYAGEIDRVILVITVLSGFWLILAEAVLFYFVFKYRRSRSPKAQYITGETKEQMKWIHWPHNLVLLCDIVILVFAVMAWYHVKQEMPPIDEEVKVVGHQWAWEFVHAGVDGQLGTDDDVATVDELHLVVDRTYKFKLEAADVLHSFSIPAFRFKQDAVPGRQIVGWFKPTKTGQYDVPCSQMCGIGHGIMGGQVYVHTADEYRQWLEKKAAKSAAISIKSVDQIAMNQGGI